MGDAQAEADRQRILQQRAADGGPRRVAARQSVQGRQDPRQIGGQERVAFLDLPDEDDIGDVLAGGALVQGLCRSLWQRLAQPRHERDGERAGQRRLGCERSRLDDDRRAEIRDGFRFGGADQPLGRFGACQLRLEGERVPQRRAVVEHGKHRLGRRRARAQQLAHGILTRSFGHDGIRSAAKRLAEFLCMAGDAPARRRIDDCERGGDGKARGGTDRGRGAGRDLDQPVAQADPGIGDRLALDQA